MFHRILLVVTEPESQKAEKVLATMWHGLEGLKPERITLPEVEQRLHELIDAGDVQVVDPATTPKEDLSKLFEMVEAGQRGCISLEGEHPAPRELVPKKTQRRRDKKLAAAQRACGALLNDDGSVTTPELPTETK